MDAELCIMNLCQPELSLDAESLNARLTRLEEQIKTGSITVRQAPAAVVSSDEDEERPPLPDDAEAPPADTEERVVRAPQSQNVQAPAGFWTDLMAATRKELEPPVQGFFVAAQNSPLRGALKGDILELRCAGAFVADSINKPVVLEVVARKAAALLGRPVRVSVVDITAKPAANPRMQQLLDFGKAHSDVVRIKE